MYKFILFLNLLLIQIPAHAYIGPGMGGGIIIAIIGFIAAIFIALFGIIYYPIKRALKKRKASEVKKQKK